MFPNLPAQQNALTEAHTEGPDISLAFRVLLGPVAAVAVWLLPLGLEPIAQAAFAIITFLIIYWIAEPIEHAITARPVAL